MLLSRTLLFMGLAFVFVGTNAVPTLGINDTGEDDLFNLGDALKEDATKPPAVHPKMPDTPLDFDDDEAPAVPKNRNSDPVHPKMPDTHFDNDEAPAVPKNRNSDPDEFDLSVAIDGDDQYTPTKPSKPAYVPNEGDSDRQFGDTDLIDAAGGLKPVQPNPEDKDKGSNQGGGNGTITGLVTGLLLALGGGVSSYILYQKKKLCFGLGNSTEQNTKQENVQGQREDPQSYSTLLQSQPIGSN